MPASRTPTVYLLSLGCNKNTVDSEVMLSMLESAGFSRTDEPGEATHLIVNTCGFIDEAKEEAIDSILELARVKEHSALHPALIVTGCLAQGYAEELHREIPEIDAIMGNADLGFVVRAVRGAFAGVIQESRRIGPGYREYPHRTSLLSLPGSAYLKISEGCSRGCSFCLIPALRGPLRSRNLESITAEARRLEGQGVREIVLTSQDTLGYGTDLYGAPSLDRLLSDLLEKTDVLWIRLLYLRPDRMLEKLLPLFNGRRLLPYFDVPVQHVAPGVLRAMGRSGGPGQYRALFDRIRSSIPGAVLRTTLMVGFTGEGESEFGQLESFVREVRFNHLGVFVFSPQEGTRAFGLAGGADPSAAEERRARIMEMQQEISRGLLAEEKGRVFDVLIEEGSGGEGPCVGRSFHFAPDVDGVFVVDGCSSGEPGGMVRARVTGSDKYDLYGRGEKT